MRTGSFCVAGRLRSARKVQLLKHVTSLPQRTANAQLRDAAASVCAVGIEVQDRMKKSVLLCLLLPLSVAACFAQESRQDVSVSGTGVFPPFVTGQAVFQTADAGWGVLGSYRYMVTPRSALEGNYQYSRNITNLRNSVNNINIHTKMQEISAAYVFSFTYKKFNPFVEGGPGAFLFTPLDDPQTQTFGAKRTTNIGGLYGGGIAYEISPSFDIRAEYRGIVVKAPNFGLTNFTTNRWYNISNPAVGIAYHF
jgi:outer membrane immunogenic protein